MYKRQAGKGYYWINRLWEFSEKGRAALSDWLEYWAGEARRKVLQVQVDNLGEEWEAAGMAVETDAGDDPYFWRMRFQLPDGLVYRSAVYGLKSA